MIQDLQYFLDEENKFCKEHPNYNQTFYDSSIHELSEYGLNDPLNFLFERKLSETLKRIEKPLGKELEYGLTDIQRVFLNMFYNNDSCLFRDDYYEHIPDVIQNMFDTFDDVISKAPINKDNILYRFCNDNDKSNMNAGDIITIPHNLTCTNYDWRQERYNNIYVITPLKDGKTRAHNLFEIYEHGDEKQVDFLRHTKFKVTKIEKTTGTDYFKYYLEELAD